MNRYRVTFTCHGSTTETIYNESESASLAIESASLAIKNAKTQLATVYDDVYAEKCFSRNSKESFSLKEHINRFYGGNQSAFARANEVKRQQVQRWLKGDFVVIEGKLYRKSRNVF